MVAVDVLLAALWLFLPSAASIPKIAGQFDVMATISHVIDENHDAEGTVAADLERLLDRLPAHISAMIRRGEVSYAPSEDRFEYKLVLPLVPPAT